MKLNQADIVKIICTDIWRQIVKQGLDEITWYHQWKSFWEQTSLIQESL